MLTLFQEIVTHDIGQHLVFFTLVHVAIFFNSWVQFKSSCSGLSWTRSLDMWLYTSHKPGRVIGRMESREFIPPITRRNLYEVQSLHDWTVYSIISKLYASYKVT